MAQCKVCNKPIKMGDALHSECFYDLVDSIDDTVDLIRLKSSFFEENSINTEDVAGIKKPKSNQRCIRL